MSIPNFGYLEGLTSLDEINGALAELKRTLDFYFQGKISTSNIREIAGWIADEDTLMSGDEDVGFSTLDSAANDLRIWAGSTSRESAPFRVYESGKMVVSDIEILGGTISWAGVGAPNYTDITGTKPPVDADSTEFTLLGNGFTKIGSNYIYTGTLNANQINVGTLTGITIQTAASGARVVMNSSEFASYDSAGNRAIAISPTTPTYGMSGIEFGTSAVTPKGWLFSNASIFGLWAQGDLNIQSLFGTTKIRGNVDLSEAFLTLPVLGVNALSTVKTDTGHAILQFSNGLLIGYSTTA